MEANEVLRLMELAAAVASGGLGAIVGGVAYRYRTEIKRAEKRRAVRKIRVSQGDTAKNVGVAKDEKPELAHV